MTGGSKACTSSSSTQSRSEASTTPGGTDEGKKNPKVDRPQSPQATPAELSKTLSPSCASSQLSHKIAPVTSDDKKEHVASAKSRRFASAATFGDAVNGSPCGNEFQALFVSTFSNRKFAEATRNKRSGNDSSSSEATGEMSTGASPSMTSSCRESACESSSVCRR